MLSNRRIETGNNKHMLGHVAKRGAWVDWTPLKFIVTRGQHPKLKIKAFCPFHREKLKRIILFRGNVKIWEQVNQKKKRLLDKIELLHNLEVMG